MIWAGFAILALLVVLALLWPVLRGRALAATRADYDLMVFEDQLKELDRDLERGVLTADEAGAARLEIQRRVLAVKKQAEQKIHSASPAWRAAVTAGVLIIVPALALGIYLPIGTPMMPGGTAAKRAELAADQSQESDRLIAQLESHMRANPDDPDGWTLLARSYRTLRRYDDAADAYRQLARLAPSGDVYANLGEVLAAASGGVIAADAHDALMNALEVDRNEPRARFYLGLEQSQLGNNEAAIAIWRDLTADAPADAPWLDLVTTQMAQTAKRAGIMPVSVEPRHPLEMDLAQASAAASPVAPSGISPENMEMIRGMVSGLAARLESEPDDYDGWMMLGRSYTVLDNVDGALGAYEKAMALKPAEIDPKMQYANLMITQTDLDAPGPLPAPLTQTMNDVLKLSPYQPDALFISGLADAKEGDAAAARAKWERALNEQPQTSPLRAEINRRIEALD